MLDQPGQVRAVHRGLIKTKSLAKPVDGTTASANPEQVAPQALFGCSRPFVSKGPRQRQDFGVCDRGGAQI